MWLSSVELVRSWSEPQCHVVASKALLPVAHLKWVVFAGHGDCGIQGVTMMRVVMSEMTMTMTAMKGGGTAAGLLGSPHQA